MLRSLKSLDHHTLSASDGEIGTVSDFLIDDERWTVRYLVAETGHFFLNRQVLISPIFFGDPDGPANRFFVNLSRAKIKGSPSIDLHQPVSRQHERMYYGYYGYPMYWGYGGLWGGGEYPGFIKPAQVSEAWDKSTAGPAGDSHLRSAATLRGYHVEGSDGSIGHVADFFVDEESWQIRYLVVDTSNWWMGTRVLVAPDWATRVSWAEQKVHLDLTRERIRQSPGWNGSDEITRGYEARLFDHYEKPAYWHDPDSDARAGKAAAGVEPMVLG